MDGYSINGLPLHVLIVHATVIAVPVAALVVLLAALWARARRWLGLVTPLLGILAASIVPLTTQAGAWLQDRLPEAPLIQAHATLGDTLWPWTLALGILSVVVYGWYRYLDARPEAEAPSTGARRVVAVVVALAALVVAAGAIWTTVLVGESGSRAVWQGSFSEDPLER